MIRTRISAETMSAEEMCPCDGRWDKMTFRLGGVVVGKGGERGEGWDVRSYHGTNLTILSYLNPIHE